MTRNLYEILVPTIIDGKPVRRRYHRVWDKKVYEISFGLTILNPTKGAWVSPGGELFEERMIPVRIMCTEEEIEKIADLTAKYYRQKAVFFYRVSDWVRVKHYPCQDGKCLTNELESSCVNSVKSGCTPQKWD